MQVTTFGEIMLRLTVPGNQKFVQTDWFHANYGGAEANVAVSLALLGDQATSPSCQIIFWETRSSKSSTNLASTQTGLFAVANA